MEPPPTGYITRRRHRCAAEEVVSVIVTGVVLMLLGYFLGINLLYTVGGILLVIGLVLWIAGALGHAVGGRTHYW